MFFPERIVSVLPTDKVLEIGPGANPHPRSDILLEKKFDSDKELFEQRGKTEMGQQKKPIVYYKGLFFPFKDKEFDYVICSQVIEHIDNVEVFIKEMCRVAKKGYLEFPTIYYDYIYNFNVHLSFVFYNNGILYWMPKKDSTLDTFRDVQFFFYKSLENNYFDFINDFKTYFFQGFEWENPLTTQKVSELNKLCYLDDIIIIPIKEDEKLNTHLKVDYFRIKNKLKSLIKKIIYRERTTQIIKNKEIEFNKSFKQFQKLGNISTNRFQLKWEDKSPFLNDNTANISFDTHYVYHTAWAARVVKQINPTIHVDISSYLYFSTILSAFIPVKFYDFRPSSVILSNFEMQRADLCNLHFESNSLQSLSCMHVIEHIGLGRYGDPLDYEGDLKAIKELKRVLMPGGDLLFVVPIGKPKIMFNAHRIYSYEQILFYFNDFILNEFSLIPDNGNETGIIENAKQEIAEAQTYACGCFWFKKA